MSGHRKFSELDHKGVKKWRILDGPNQVANTGGVDGDVWILTIENVNDPAQRRIVQVVIAGSVLNSDRVRLMTEIRKAVESNGKTALERFLDDQNPPGRIIVSSTGIRPSDE
jgi:hypothetical protein